MGDWNSACHLMDQASPLRDVLVHRVLPFSYAARVCLCYDSEW